MLDPVAADEEEPSPGIEPARLDHGETGADGPAEPPVQLEAAGEPGEQPQKAEHGQKGARTTGEIEGLHGGSARPGGGVAAPRPAGPIEPVELAAQPLPLGRDLHGEPFELVEEGEEGRLLLGPGGRPPLGLGERLEPAFERLEPDRVAGREPSPSGREGRLEGPPFGAPADRERRSHDALPCRRAAAMRASSR